jgi:hypothetical protein
MRHFVGGGTKNKDMYMRKMLIGLGAAAAVAVALASPASAQGRHGGHMGGHMRGHMGSFGGHGGFGHFGGWGGPRIGLSFGPGYYGYGAYGYDCPVIRVRHVTPRGRVFYRYVRDCY